MKRKIFGVINTGIGVGLCWCFLSLILESALLPLHDYKGSFFSSLFFWLWSFNASFFLATSLAFALFGALLALAFGLKEHAKSLSFGFAVLPFAFFILLPENDYISSSDIALAAIKAVFVCVACASVSIALSPSKAKAYMNTVWFRAFFAIFVGAFLCLMFANLHEWAGAKSPFHFKVGCASFLLFLWSVMSFSYPDRTDEAIFAFSFAFFIGCFLVLWIGGLRLELAFFALFFAGYFIAIILKGTKDWLGVFVIATIALFWLASELWGILISRGGEASRPNFVVVVSDSLRYDAIEPHGGEVVTPNISELASSSIVFERAYSVSPWTLPSIGSLLTGLYPTAIGIDKANHSLDERFITLAERLKGAGYFTCAIYDSPFILDSAGFEQGFDVVIGVRERMKFRANDRLDVFRSSTIFYWQLARVAPRFDHTLGSAHLALIALKRIKKPFLLWIHLLDPHQPYVLPKDFAGHIKDVEREFDWKGRRTKILRWTTQALSDCYESSECDNLIKRARELYLGEVRLVDFVVGRIVERLKDLGLWDDTVFIFTSDHGEEFGERFGLGHGRTLYEELLRVPLIVRVPALKHKTIYTRVRTMDINPTILELAQIPYESASFNAMSLLPVVGGFEISDREVFAETNLKGDLKRALVFGDYKLICSRRLDSCELFNLVSDPLERNPIVDDNTLEDLRARLFLLSSSCERSYEQMTGKKRQYDRKLAPDAIERLKAMGYI